MAVDELRARYLRDRVLTATPAQRVVMLYDRLGLDLTLAASAEDSFAVGERLSHAMQVVAELQASLDVTAGGPAENLTSIYGYLMSELIAARGGEIARLDGAARIVTTLREAWAKASESVTSTPPDRVAAGTWVG
jgi:flagellar protein FliS